MPRKHKQNQVATKQSDQTDPELLPEDPVIHRSNQIRAMKGFKDAVEVDHVLGAVRHNPIRQEIEDFLQWDVPRESV